MSAGASVADAPRPAPPAVQRARAAALAALVGTMMLWALRELWLAPTGSGTLLVLVLPLALAWLGLWRHRMVTFRWLSLLLWLYFGLAVIRATTEAGIARWLAVAEVGLLLWLFAACVVYIRQRLHSPRPDAVEAEG
jgi:uncharacterized membrane protein